MTLSPQGVCFEGAHEQQIDIGARRQLAAAIAAGRHHRDALGRGRVLRVVEMLGGEIVDHLDGGVLQIGQRARRHQARRAPLSTRASRARAPR